MKKLSFLLVLPLVLLVIGCWKDKVDITDTDFEYEVDVCDEYFELAECIIDNTKNEDWTEILKNDLRLEIKMQQDERKNLSEEQLTRNCSGMLDNILENSTELVELWCLKKK